MNGREQGFTVIEVLIALAVFAIVIVGAIGAVGATGGGFLETVPTGLVTTRSAKDMTAAATYLQALHECAATVGGGGVTPGTTTYTASSSSAPLGCEVPNATPPPPLIPLLPSTEPYQLEQYTLTVTFETLVWNGSQYAPGSCDPATNADCVVRMRTTLGWKFKGVPKPSITVQRLLPP